MYAQTIKDLTKEKLGIRSEIRDTYILAITEGVIKELEDELGLVLDETNAQHVLFVTDYVEFRYKNTGEDMPRHLKYRMHNLMIHNGGDAVG